MGIDFEALSAKKKEMDALAARRRANYLRLVEGRNVIRVLPPWNPSGGEFFLPFGQHWGLGADGKTVVNCPFQCYGKPCPICDELEKLRKIATSDAQKEWIKRASSSPRFYVNAIDMKEPDKGPQVCELPQSVMSAIIDIMIDKDTGIGDITALDKGFDIIIDRVGSGLLTKYTVKAKREPSAIKPSLAEGRADLTAFVTTLGYSELKNIWDGKTPERIAAPATAPMEALEAPAAAAAPEVLIPEVIEPEAPSAPTAPKCYGSFNDEDDRCLDCAEQDECEMAMLEQKRKLRAAKAKGKAAAPKPAATPAPATEEISTDDLMKEMESAISR